MPNLDYLNFRSFVHLHKLQSDVFGRFYLSQKMVIFTTISNTIKRRHDQLLSGGTTNFYAEAFKLINQIRYSKISKINVVIIN